MNKKQINRNNFSGFFSGPAGKNHTIIILFAIVFLATTFSCMKNPEINPAKDITGQWEWVYTNNLINFSDTLTPQNTGIEEVLVFNTNNTWYKKQNDIKTDSGSFSVGHGTYSPFGTAEKYVYDSIVYFANEIQLENGWDYYAIYADTLKFSPGFAGKESSYTLPLNGSKLWTKKR